MTDTTHNFDPIPRLQQIAATIRERGAYTFDAPATAAYYIECAIKEIERLRKEAFHLAANQCHAGYGGEYGHHRCREIDRLTAERDEARREVCSMNETGLRMNESDKKREAKRRGWDCFKEGT